MDYIFLICFLMDLYLLKLLGKYSIAPYISAANPEQDLSLLNYPLKN